MDLSFIIPVARAAEEAHSSGVLGTLGLNLPWFVGQLINFAVVVFVFWKWVIPALQKRLEARTNYIAQSVKNAEDIEKQHADLAAWKKQLMESAEAEAAKDLQERKAQAEKLTENMLATARAEQEKLLASARKQIEQEREQATQTFKQDMANLVVSATQKIVQEKLDKDKDKSLVKKVLSEVTGV